MTDHGTRLEPGYTESVGTLLRWALVGELLCLGTASAAEPRATESSAPPAADSETTTQEFGVRREVNWGLTLAGAFMVGVPYALGVPSAFLNNMQGGSAWMLAPVFGPLAGSLVVSDSGYQCAFVKSSGPTDCNSPLFLELLWFDSIVQTAGAALLTWGLVGRPTVVRKDLSAWLTPSLSPGTAGLRILGTF